MIMELTEGCVGLVSQFLVTRTLRNRWHFDVCKGPKFSVAYTRLKKFGLHLFWVA